MDLLLDTQALLWWLSGGKRLGPAARAAITEPGNTLWMSAASSWEIAIKWAVGRLNLEAPPDRLLRAATAEHGFSPLAISVEHTLVAGTLPPIHADPFDRLLIAQAMTDGLTIITANAVFARYGVAVLPA